MLDSNLNSLLNFRFELNPGNKRSIESYKNLYSFIHPQKKKKKPLFICSQFRDYGKLFGQWSSGEIKTVGSISPMPAVGAEALGWGFLEPIKLALHWKSHNQMSHRVNVGSTLSFGHLGLAPLTWLYKEAVGGTEEGGQLKTQCRYWSLIGRLAH